MRYITRLLPLLYLPALSVFAYEEGTNTERDADAALGINEFFGRWDGAVNLVYDPDGAPVLFANSSDVLEILEEAAGKWEQVSGINFNITGVDSGALDDELLDINSQDGLVRVFWDNIGGAAGLAGPDFDSYDFDVGYYPYYDGSVRLTEVSSVWESTSLLDTLVHELGHLIGLGHSDNPASVMYANPYNNLLNPREDDIRAARALYGEGTLDIEDISQPVSQWLYQALPLAPASATGNLFKPNLVSDEGVYIDLGDNVALTEINSNTPNGTSVFFSFALGPAASDINIDASIVYVDPFGYRYDNRETILDCGSGVSCERGFSIASTAEIKTIPGNWTVYVVDNDSQETLLEFPFTVNSTVNFNAAPEAEITVEGISNTAVNISLNITDADSDTVEVIWHPHGNLGDQNNDGFLDTDIRDTVQSGQSINRDISFLNADTHTLYIELNDNEARYDGSNPGSSSAGDGFQSLIALTVDLPVDSDNNVSITTTYGEVSSGGQGGGGGSDDPVSTDEVVNSIADSTALELITASDGSSSSASFGAGASADSGSSTATEFSDGQDITIAGSVEVQSGDIGEAGEVFVVLFTDDGLTYMDTNGDYVTWNGSLKTIEPAFSISSLSSVENFGVYSGTVQSGLYRVFLGYRLTADGPIHFNAKAFRITVN